MRRMRAAGSAFTRAVLLCFLGRTLLGFLVALPVSAAIGASGVSALPQADRALFEPGGLLLLELVRTEGRSLPAALGVSGWLLLSFGLALGAVSNALLFRASWLRQEPLKSAVYGSLSVFGRFLALACIELLSWSIVLALSLAIGRQLAVLIGLGEIASDVVAMSFLLAGVAFGAAVSVILDLARASSFEPLRLGFGKALQHAVLVALRAPAPLASSYLLTRGTGLFLVALGARAAELLDVGREGDLRLYAVALTHQAVLFGLTLLRAAFVVRVNDTLHASTRVSSLVPRRSDRSERSAGPVDPSPNHGA